MNVIKVNPRGYCKGVVRAIQIAKQTVEQYPSKKVYILGMLVHNTYVIKALNQYGIITLDDKNKSREELLDLIQDGVVIFSAHGISERIKKKAKEKGLITVDATCPDVLKTQLLVNKYIENGYHIFYIGKQNHPEASAICDGNKQITLIEKVEDIATLPHYDNVFVTNQTTMSVYDIEFLFKEIKQIYPNTVFSEEICNATRIRQEAIANLNAIDTLIIVGDKASNNSSRLAQIGKENNIKEVYLIDNVNDLVALNLSDNKQIAVSSGASTPTYLTNQVIQALEKKEFTIHQIEIEKIL